MFDQGREETCGILQSHDSHVCRKCLTLSQPLKLYDYIEFENVPIHETKCI